MRRIDNRLSLSKRQLPKVTARTQKRSVANRNRRIQRQIKASIKKPKAGAKAKPGASEAKPIKVRKGEKVAVVLSGGNPRIAKANGEASRLIDQRIRDLGGWRGETLARMR